MSCKTYMLFVQGDGRTRSTGPVAAPNSGTVVDGAGYLTTDAEAVRRSAEDLAKKGTKVTVFVAESTCEAEKVPVQWKAVC